MSLLEKVLEEGKINLLSKDIIKKKLIHYGKQILQNIESQKQGKGHSESGKGNILSRLLIFKIVWIITWGI